MTLPGCVLDGTDGRVTVTTHKRDDEKSGTKLRGPVKRRRVCVFYTSKKSRKMNDEEIDNKESGV